jgi:hypothetical protein
MVLKQAYDLKFNADENSKVNTFLVLHKKMSLVVPFLLLPIVLNPKLINTNNESDTTAVILCQKKLTVCTLVCSIKDV